MRGVDSRLGADAVAGTVVTSRVLRWTFEIKRPANGRSRKVTLRGTGAPRILPLIAHKGAIIN